MRAPRERDKVDNGRLRVVGQRPCLLVELSQGKRMQNKEAADHLAERARELMGSDDLDTRERGERLMSEAERQWREIPTMKDPPGLTKRLLCSVILIYGGTAFLWATAGWKIALGIFLVIWGIDLRLQVNEALTKRLRETLTW